MPPLTSPQVKALATSLGFELVGICAPSQPAGFDFFQSWIADGMHAQMAYMARHAELRRDPATLLPGLRSIIAVGLIYNQPNPTVPGEVKIARYALGRDYHKVIRGKLRRLAKALADVDPTIESRITIDSAPIFEREFAQMAGLGWFGKNTCLINSQMGSWFLLGLLLTTAELEPDAPAIGGCGTCRICIDACPTGAIVPHAGRWRIDSRSCISAITIEKRGELTLEEQDMIGDWTFGCDVCQEVCPFNHPRESQPLRAPQTREPDFLRRLTPLPITRLNAMSPEEWDTWSGGSPVRRAGLEGMQRNAKSDVTD